jgi:hypothetical protein
MLKVICYRNTGHIEPVEALKRFNKLKALRQAQGDLSRKVGDYKNRLQKKIS